MTGDMVGEATDPDGDVTWLLLMISETAATQVRIQELVMEYGENVPLELLLSMNILNYGQYREWRDARIESLYDILSAGTSGTEKLLRDAGFRVGEQDLEPPLDELLCTRFRRTGIIGLSGE